jgi:tetratricopeptide (TPR) repeat protein
MNASGDGNLCDERRIPEAEEYLRKNLEEQPGELQAMADLGDLYLAAKDWKRAEAAYVDIRRKASQSALGFMRMGEYYAARKIWDRAAEEYEEAVKRDPGQDALFTSLVRIYAGQKKFGPAISACEARVRRNPKDAYAWHLMGQVYGGQGDSPKAEEALRKAMDADPENLINYQSLARLYASGKDYPKAVQIYEKALSKQQDFWPAANDLAALLSDHGRTKEDLDRALALAQRAARSRPEEGVVQDTLGWVYYRRGDTRRALEYLRIAQGKLPENPEVNYHLGMALARDGKREEAKRHLQKSVASQGEFPGKEEAAKTLAGR